MNSEQVIPGVNDQMQHNEWVTDLQDQCEFSPLIDFLERLKEPEIREPEGDCRDIPN